MKCMPFILHTSFQAVASTLFPTIFSVTGLRRNTETSRAANRITTNHLYKHHRKTFTWKRNTFQIGATWICTAQIKTSCLKLHHCKYTCDRIWPIRRSVAAFTAQMCCQREGLIKVTLMEMQLITAPCWWQGESVAGNIWRTRCGTLAESH